MEAHRKEAALMIVQKEEAINQIVEDDFTRLGVVLLEKMLTQGNLDWQRMGLFWNLEWAIYVRLN